MTSVRPSVMELRGLSIFLSSVRRTETSHGCTRRRKAVAVVTHARTLTLEAHARCSDRSPKRVWARGKKNNSVKAECATFPSLLYQLRTKAKRRRAAALKAFSGTRPRPTARPRLTDANHWTCSRPVSVPSRWLHTSLSPCFYDRNVSRLFVLLRKPVNSDVTRTFPPSPVLSPDLLFSTKPL